MFVCQAVSQSSLRMFAHTMALVSKQGRRRTALQDLRDWDGDEEESALNVSRRRKMLASLRKGRRRGEEKPAALT